MHKKIWITFSIISLLLLTFCSCGFAANEAMSNAKNSMMNVGSSLGDAAVNTKNAVVSGAKDIGNGLSNLGESTMNTIDNMGNSMTTSMSTMGTENSNYTATRTAATNNNLLGLSSTAWTWLILGIVGAIIVGLVWYYGAQYEHKNYNHD